MITNIIIGLIALLIGALLTFFLSKKFNKKTISVIKEVGKSEANDSVRKDVISKSDNQIKSNNGILKRAKALIKKNREVIDNAKKNINN